MGSYGMLFLLNIQHRPILKRPLRNIGLRARTLDLFGFGEFRPEIVEVLEFDEVPHVGEGRGDDGGLGD